MTTGNNWMIAGLKSALRLGDAPRLAFVGAGGKTTALFRLAREYPTPVIATATTHLELWQARLADAHYACTDLSDCRWPAAPRLRGVSLFTGRPGNRSLAGLDYAAIRQTLHLADERQAPLLIEADGARRHPLKAPAAHEPPIPKFVDTVVVTVGLSGLGHALTADWVHRPDIFAALAGAPPGKPIHPDALRRVLRHPSGGLKNIPGSTRRVALLNQVDTPELLLQARRLARGLLKNYHAVVSASLCRRDPLDTRDNLTVMETQPAEIYSVYEPIAGIILAAGASARMGRPKLLLPWQGEPLIRHTARTALEAGLFPVIVVTGAYGAEVEAALTGLEVQIAANPEWETGQGSSVRAGVAALPSETGAAIFLLGDQPQIPASLLQALAEAHAQSQAPVIAPLIDGQRGNPVLFDRAVFPDLLLLRGDAGARQVFSRYPPQYLPWNDPAPLWDIDTPADYQRLVNAAGVGKE